DNFGYGEFTGPLYSSIPFYYAEHEGRFHGLFLDSPAQPFFDLDSAGEGSLTLGAYQQELDYYLFAGPTPLKVADGYARITGFAPLPPRWALGFHQSRYGYQSWQEIMTVAETFRQLDIPLDVVYLDLDYMNDLDWFSWDPLDFPDPEGHNRRLEAMGIKRVNILDPAIQPDDPLYPLLAEQDLFLEDAAGDPVLGEIFLPFGQVSWVDYTNPALGQFYMDRLKAFLETGVSAIWNDINEPASNFMPHARYDFAGQERTDLQARNLYALANVQWTWQAMREARPDERPFILSRSGYAGSQRYIANWSGDSLSTFDSLRVSIQNSLHMALSGILQFGHDIGGFLGSPDGELFTRWLQFASFNPFFRNHAVNTSHYSEPWVYGEPYTAIIRQAIEGRYRLLPYFYSLAEATARTAEPILRPLWWEFPDDALAYEQDDTFLIGPALLVAPVHQQGATARQVYLPSGSDWYDRHSGRRHTGGQHLTVAAPLERIPQFVRAGALLPQGPLRQYADQPVQPRLELDLYPGPATSFELYEDDGISYAYRQGHYRRIPLTQASEDNVRSLRVGTIQGDWIPPRRPWVVRFHDLAQAPRQVSLNGQPLMAAADEAALEGLEAGWWYRPDQGVLVVRMTEPASQDLLAVSP
ncbi:MAG: glycoside hydrolase family 31 protein, partial [Candidatus Competibacteraceae bacterium]|nr:glycoside hydrolase family 31 protein [Candidatus Competibacteraceae bacterium]